MASISAIGLPSGRFSVDGNGCSHYSYDLKLPDGTGTGNTPKWSLEYSQDGPNGPLGMGWSISGTSAIQRVAASIAVDGFTASIQYDPSRARFALDGQRLFNVTQTYGEPGALYKTELDRNSHVRDLGKFEGFEVIDATGGFSRYGTTEDSRSLSKKGDNVREWHLQREVDSYGNTTTFKYRKTPQMIGQFTGSAQESCSYIDSIEYTSNTAAGLSANRFVEFFYTGRPDVVKVTGAGDQISVEYLLAEIRVSIASGWPLKRWVVRSYHLAHISSGDTGASLLSSITLRGTENSSITPTTFTYQGDNHKSPDWFRGGGDPYKVLPGSGNMNNIALIPLNISGNLFADLACISKDSDGQLMVRTYIASTEANLVDGDMVVKWDSFTTARLPKIASTSNPIFLTADLRGMGVTDIIMPFQQGTNLSFAISQSTRSGFNDYVAVTKNTVKWTNDSRFFALDCDGNGQTDIVEIYRDSGDIGFRTFFSVYAAERTTLSDPKVSTTSITWSADDDWVVMDHDRDGAADLLRIWKQKSGSKTMLKATIFKSVVTSVRNATFKQHKTSDLGEYFQGQTTAISCDINGDGLPDILVCNAVIEPAAMRKTRVKLTYRAYLYDGEGLFEPLGFTDSYSEDYDEARAPMDKQGFFQVLHLDGSGCPCISYVFRRKETMSWASYIARGSSSGKVHSPVFKLLTNNADKEKTSISSIDVNGTGKGGWIESGLSDQKYRYRAIYNRMKRPDILAKVVNPMGLRVEVTYKPLSDPCTYRSKPGHLTSTLGNADLNSSMPVIASIQHVVSKVTMSNDQSINSLLFESSVEHAYIGARRYITGRGWQGFSEVWARETTSNVLTVNTYEQAWPATGTKIKEQISHSLVSLRDRFGTKNRPSATHPCLKNDEILKTRTSTYTARERDEGKWKMYSINPVLDQTDTFDGSTLACRVATASIFDTEDNLILENPYQISGTAGNREFQLWIRSSFVTVNGVRGKLAAKKVSTQCSNSDMGQYQDGDVSLQLFSYDGKTGSVTEEKKWSTEHQRFVSQKLEHDLLGNRTRVVSSIGLEDMTSYDDVFRNYPVERCRKGSGIEHREQFLIDLRYGLQVATMERNGRVLRTSLDAFGRPVMTGISSVSGDQVWNPPPLPNEGQGIIVGNKSFLGKVSDLKVSPNQQAYFVVLESGHSRFLTKKIQIISKLGTSDGVEEVQNFYDCTGRVRKTMVRQGTADSSRRIWQVTDFDARGNKTLESSPTDLSGQGSHDKQAEWKPPPESCLVTKFDALQRPLEERKAKKSNASRQKVTRYHYTQGGMRAIASVGMDEISSQLNSQSFTLLETTQQLSSFVYGQTRLTESIDAAGLKTMYKYDGAARIILIQAPGNTEEERSYSSLGDLIMGDNNFQSPSKELSRNPALRRKYNEASQMVEETNALGMVTRFENDLVDRLTKRLGSDGRIVSYVYDAKANDIGNVSSITVTMPNSKIIESSHALSYDIRGQLVSSELRLSPEEVFKTSFTYDLQGQLTSKTLPDNTVVSLTRNGKEVHTMNMSAAGQKWNLCATYEKYNAFGSATEWTLNGSDIMANGITTRRQHDLANIPVSHRLSSAKTLLENNYFYTDLDRLRKVHETSSGDTVEYEYECERLKLSKPANGPETRYNYDDTGNILSKGRQSFTYNGLNMSGITAGSGNNLSASYEARYDGIGRLINRVHNMQQHSFTYDGWGQMVTILNQSTKSTTTLVSDFSGRNLVRTDQDGSRRIRISKDFEITKHADGSQTIRKKFFGAHNILAMVTSTVKKGNAIRDSNGHAVAIFFTNQKGNVSHILDGSGAVKRKLEYDDFGLASSAQHLDEAERSATYESTEQEKDTGLLNFGARWYDPVAGRFTTPDNIWGVDHLFQKDALNRHVFESNDPINNIDPTGHWTWRSIFGLILGIVLVVAAIALTVATAGAATGLAAFAMAGAIGAVMGAGGAAIDYSVNHQDETDSAKFFGGLAANMAIGAAVGAVTGFAAAWVGGASVIGVAANSIAGRFGSAAVLTATKLAIKAGITGLIGAAGGVLGKLGSNGVEQQLYDPNTDLTSGLAGAALFGFVGGAVAAAGTGPMGNAGGKFTKSALQVAPKLAPLGKLVAIGATVAETAMGFSGMLEEFFPMGWDGGAVNNEKVERSGANKTEFGTATYYDLSSS